MDIGLRKAIEFYKTKTAIAAALGLTHQAVSHWKKIPTDAAIDLEKDSRGELLREDLRSDYFLRRHPDYFRGRK